jgi:HSP20 family protein
MQLIRFNPIREMNNFRHRMNHMFDNAFTPTLKEDEALSMWNWKPAVDIYDNDRNIVIKAELPGMEKKDIILQVNGRVLTLKGEHSSENEVKEDKYHRRERSYGKFERVFTLPAEVDPDKITADYKDGVLKIDIPKPEEQKPKQITVH